MEAALTDLPLTCMWDGLRHQTRCCYSMLSRFCTLCRAREAIQAAYGDSVKVYSVPAREILCGGGNIHCMSMQMAQG